MGERKKYVRDGMSFDVWDFDRNKIYNTYKIYGLYSLQGNIFYIGCTSNILTRLSGHATNNYHGHYKTQLIRNYIANGDKIKVVVFFSFNSKIIAGICERILINFVKKHINPYIFNMDARLDEEKMLVENKNY